jgi:hypothetical protein
VNLKDQLAIQAMYEAQAATPKPETAPTALLAGEPVAPKPRGRPRKAAD